MSAPAGNTNATRWTHQQTHDMLDQIEELAWDESIHTLSQALLKVKGYKQLWSYWKKTWALEGDIMDRIYYIEQIFINKLEEGALFKRLNPSACYFILRQNYGYDSRAEPELPSHLVAELEASAAEVSATDTQTKVGKDSAATDAVRQPLLQPATVITSTGKNTARTSRQAMHHTRQ
ncbi:MAG: hypothetical protein JST76_13795 [Bacteroidetes bacterium]|nr:hypothetical protein [Bacteroidota bacterium]